MDEQIRMENLKKLSMGKVNITQTNLMLPQIIDFDSKEKT